MFDWVLNASLISNPRGYFYSVKPLWAPKIMLKIFQKKVFFYVQFPQSKSFFPDSIFYTIWSCLICQKNIKKSYYALIDRKSCERCILHEIPVFMNVSEAYSESSQTSNIVQEMKFSIKDFFSKCDQICRKLQIWSHLLKRSLKGNFIFCAV